MTSSAATDDEEWPALWMGQGTELVQSPFKHVNDAPG